MNNPSLEEFLRLSARYNLIPVYRQISADLDTPVSALLKIGNGDYSFLLESVEGREKIARYSFLGGNPSVVFKSKAGNIEISYPETGKTSRFITKLDPLAEIKKIMKDFRPVRIKGLPRFYGGFVGYIGYDMVRFFEKLPDKNPDELNLPDSVLILTDTLLVFDHVNHTIKIIVNSKLPKGLTKAGKIKAYNSALQKIGSIQKNLEKPLPQAPNRRIKTNLKINSNFTKSQFEDMVIRAKEYIRKGDIIQVVPSQRFKVNVGVSPLDVYRKLRSLNPSPYMFFLKLRRFFLIGASPEMLVRCEEGVARTRPIAGTKPRGKNEEEDLRLEKELLSDVKEKAEHLMLVDLGRNDLGRVCRRGEVKVSEFMQVERYSHVMHLVSEVEGRLDNKYDVYDVLRACFPAGTVSGSPKIRAMEIIDELENSRRGPYAGCVGYFSFSGNMDTCITIRTVVIKDKTGYVQAGGGVVADSVPEKEYLESVNKAKALIEAITN
ncbi:MAG: anthranilate synthase component I [Candidatus Omnitrophica bacterium]|nr:anthranilate synthase component I [Candidatus Omnitrophota bacterium]MDD5553174.1 anthranilate synthase component I [Candidatus Omnitrophota bacterium]